MTLKVFQDDEQPEPGKKPPQEVIDRYKRARDRVGTVDRSARPRPGGMVHGGGGDFFDTLQKFRDVIAANKKPRLGVVNGPEHCETMGEGVLGASQEAQETTQTNTEEAQKDVDEENVKEGADSGSPGENTGRSPL